MNGEMITSKYENVLIGDEEYFKYR